MKIILLGAGSIGKSIVANLTLENHEVTVIDHNQEKINDLVNSYDIEGIAGEGTNKDILQEAKISNCELFIATTHSDDSNIVACLLAKKLGAKHTIARVRSTQYNDESSLLSDLGISLLINPEKETAEEIFKIISVPSALKVDSFNHDVNIFELAIGEGNKLIGKTIKEIRNEYSVDILVASITRGDDIIIPNGLDFIMVDDKVNFIASKEDMFDFFYQIQEKVKPLKNIMIIGGGITTEYLLKNLVKSKCKVKVLENDKTKCNQLAQAYNKIEFINGDGTSTDLLLNTGLENADALVSLAPLDEENLISSVFASSHDVKKVILRLNRSNISNTIEQTRFASVVSPKQVTADRVLSYVRKLDNPYGNAVVEMHKIVDGKVEASEFKITEDCKLIDCQLKDIKLKDDVLIASIIRDGKTIIPGGLNKIKLEDHIIVISKEGYSDVNKIIK